VGCQVRVLEAGLGLRDVEEGPLGRGVQGLVVRDDLSGHRPWTVEAIGTRELWSYASAVLQVVPVSSAVTPGAHTCAATGPITASFSATLRHADIAVDGHCARRERGSSEFSTVAVDCTVSDHGRYCVGIRVEDLAGGALYLGLMRVDGDLGSDPGSS
ncbi:hypothetical protein HaLaN_24164, partial [Haematococcus lacustris]